MLMEVLAEEFVRDWKFEEFRHKGLPRETFTALTGFWSKAEFTGLATELRLPHPDWGQTVECLASLLQGDGPGDRALWAHVAEASQEVAADNPVAASIISLYPLARWEGILGRDLYKQQYRRPNDPGWRQLDLGWQTFPLAAARNLDRADAFWSARRLSRTAVEAIENTLDWTSYARLREPHITAPYREVLLHASRRYEECVDNLAWDLRESCRLQEPNFRPEVAALFWSLGDVPHAQLLHNTACMPSREAVGGLVRRSLQVMHVDPALQEIWLRLKDRPPFSLREHRELFVSINLYWAPLSSHLGPGGGQHQVDLLGIGNEPPSRGYAAAVGEYFRTGVSEETIQRLRHIHLLNSSALAMWAPEALHRLRSFLTLTMEPPPPWEPSRADRWALLADAACAIVDQREHDISDVYDRTIDIPFYYLERHCPARLAQAIELTERYREAGKSFWRHAVTPSTRSQDPEADNLRSREQDLIAALRANRYFSLLRFLPPGSDRLEVVESSTPSVMGDANPDVVSQLVKKAPGRVGELTRELDAIGRQIAAVDPEYRASRITMPATIDEFAAALIPKLAGCEHIAVNGETACR